MKREAGFTLVELLVSLAVTAVLILGVLATFDFSARMNRVQLNVADMQQSLRIAQNEIVKLARMAGRGSLPLDVAIEVQSNVPANEELVNGKPETGVLQGTDILTIRGVFNSSLYQIQYLNPAVWGAPQGLDKVGWVGVLPTAAGVPQDLDALEEIAKQGETLLLVTPFGVTSVAEITGFHEQEFKPEEGEEGEDGDEDGLAVTGLVIEFKKHLQEDKLGVLGAGLPAVAQIGLLEEHVFYVRSTGAAGVAPSLARARMDPGTGRAYKQDEEGVANATLDIADNIADLQVVRGGTPELRVTTLARTDRADPGNYQASALPAMIEDHAYSPGHPFNSATGRRYRWRLMRTDINLRNL